MARKKGITDKDISKALKPKLGRPTKLNMGNLKKAIVLAEEGKLLPQISKEMNITPKTVYMWQKRYPSFCNALKSGRVIVDDTVELNLLTRALGFDYEEQSIEEVTNNLGEKIIRKKITKKKFAPDVTAQIFWLKNRQPERWKDRKEINTELKNTTFAEWMQGQMKEKK